MERQHLSQTKNSLAPPQTQTHTSERSSAHPIEELQGAIGNQAVNQLLANQPIVQAKPMFKGLSGELAIQPKLTIGAMGDQYEQEADHISQQVVNQIHAPQRLTHVVQQNGGALHRAIFKCPQQSLATASNGKRSETIQRKVIDANNQEMTLDMVMADLNSNMPGNLSSIGPSQLKKMLSIVINSSESLTIQQVRSLKNSSNPKISGLASRGADNVDASNLKSTKKKVDKLIKAAKGSGFESALSPKNPKSDDQLLTGVHSRGNMLPADRQRRNKNLKNLLANLPKVKIKKGTKLMHMTTVDEAWLKESFVGQNNTQNYSFFCIFNDDVQQNRVHTTSFAAAVIYSLKQDVFAFYVQDYKKIITRTPEEIYTSEGKQKGEQKQNLELGGSFATTLINDLPTDKRPIAFVSPSENELAFFNGLIPAIMQRQGLVKPKEEGKKVKAKDLMDPNLRKFEVLHN